VYNNRSVLENHHCSTLFKLLYQTPEFLSSLSRRQWGYVRELVIEMILSTDMACHHDLKIGLEGLPSKLDSMRYDSVEPDAAKNRKLLLQGVLHMSDLYTPSLEWSRSWEWVSRLGAEFRQQVELERQEGLRESTFLLYSSQVEQAEKETGFVSKVVLPFYENVARVLPELSVCSDMIKSNLECWEQVRSGVPASEVQPDQDELVGRWAVLPVQLTADATSVAALPADLHKLAEEDAAKGATDRRLVRRASFFDGVNVPAPQGRRAEQKKTFDGTSKSIVPSSRQSAEMDAPTFSRLHEAAGQGAGDAARGHKARVEMAGSEDGDEEGMAAEDLW